MAKAKDGMSRREFLKNAGIIAGGTAIGGSMFLSGCSTPAAEPAPAASAAPAAPAAPTAPAEDKKYWLPEKWDKEVEVVVVGTGCGMAAAIEAKTQGADVLVIEKSEAVGGLYKTAGGHAIIGGTHIQKAAGIEDSLDMWYEDELKVQGYRGVPALIRTYVDKGPEFVQWMEDMGFIWDPTPVNANPEINRAARSHWTGHNPTVFESQPNATRGFGLGWSAIWEKKFAELGIPVLFNHRMRKIYREPNGPVVGILVDTPEGQINIKATKGVIVCSGTWTDNYRMAQAWDIRAVGPDCYGDGGTPCDGKLLVDSAGDGQIATVDVGAGFSDMSFVSYYYLFFGSRSYWGWEPPDYTKAAYYASGKGISRSADFYRNVAIVNGTGARYVNELLGSQRPDPAKGECGGLSENVEWPFNTAYLNLMQPRNVWAVADSATAEALKWPIDTLKNPNPKTGNMFDPACIAIADTIEELATKMGIPAAELKATIEKYNGFAKKGTDEDFGKEGPFNEIAQPPFYGLKASLIRHTQRNGIRVNTKSQVIEQADQIAGYNCDAVDSSIGIDDEKVIPHLYAAGELGNIMGWRRLHGSLANYAIFARIAGENAAKETPIS